MSAALRAAITQRDGAKIATLLDNAGESARGTWLESIARAYRSREFDDLAQAFEFLLEQYKETSNGYLTPVVAKVVARLPSAAHGHADSLRKCKELLDSMFRFTRTGGEAEHQSLSLLVIVLLFKVFFSLDTPALGRNLIRSVSQPGFPALNEFNLRDQVMFRLYSGRLNMLEDDAGSAQRDLQFVYAALPSDDLARRRVVFEYLVPVKMTLGFRPNLGVLTALGLGPLVEVTQAVRAGNGRLFATLLDRHRKRFIRRGSYLMICRLKLVASRQLLKASVKALDSGNKVSLSRILPLFQKWDDFDPNEDAMEQLKCVVVNLIYEGLVRGYVSHEHGVLVLSAKEPFPKTAVVLGGIPLTAAPGQ